MQEHNRRNHGHSGCGGLWRIGALADRHRVPGAAAAAGCGGLRQAAAGCGASAQQRRGIVSEAQRLLQAVAHQRVYGAALCPS